MKLFSYDIWDSDKGIILADSEEEAVKIFHDEYEGVPVVGYDCEELAPQACDIEEVSEFSKDKKIYYLYD